MKNDTFSSLTTNKGESVIDFNYFVINKTTWKGIFSSYRGAFSINSFCVFINQLLKNKIKVEQPNARETPLDAVEKSVYKEKSIPNI